MTFHPGRTGSCIMPLRRAVSCALKLNPPARIGKKLSKPNHSAMQTFSRVPWSSGASAIRAFPHVSGQSMASARHMCSHAPGPSKTSVIIPLPRVSVFLLFLVHPRLPQCTRSPMFLSSRGFLFPPSPSPPRPPSHAAAIPTSKGEALELIN